MNEKEDTIQTPKQKIPILGIISLLFGILGISAIVFRIAFYLPWWSEYVARNIVGLSGIAGLIIGWLALVKISRRITFIILIIIIFSFLLHGFAVSGRDLQFPRTLSGYLSLACLGVLLIVGIALRRLPKYRKRYKSSFLTISGIVITFVLSVIWFTETCMPAATAVRMACGSNMARLGRTIMMYSNDNQGCYPDPDQWCNLLLQYDHIKKTDFLCTEIKYRWKKQVFPLPVPKNYECYYAINPKCEPNSSQDTVLLFEIEGGWNKSGGPELLTTNNHRGDGCNILFNGNYVDFISTRKLGNLKWETAQNEE